MKRPSVDGGWSADGRLTIGFMALLSGDAIPVDIHPAAVVRHDVGTGAEDAVLGANPCAFAHLEGLAQRVEFASVGAVGESAHHLLVMSALALAQFFARVADFSAEIERGILECHRFIDCFSLALVGLAAFHLGEREALFGMFHREGGIVAPEDDETRALAHILFRGLEGHLRGDGLCGSGRLLQEHVGDVGKVLIVLLDGERVEAEVSFVARAVGPLLVVVGLPLPLESQGETIELVAFLRSADGIGLADIGLAAGQHGVAASVSVIINANDGPVVNPTHGLQVDEASVCAHVLEVEEPVFTRGSVDPCALVRAVDRAFALGKHDAVLIGTIDVARALHGLESGGHAACGVEDVIVSVPLVELRSFACALSFVPVENDARGRDGFRCVGIEFAHGNDALESGTAPGIGMSHVDASVVVPQRGGVDDAFAGLHQHRLAPRAARVFGLHHECALVGVAPEDVELPLMMTDARRPDAFAVLRRGVGCGRHGPRYGRADNAPVHQVFGMQNLQARHAVEARRGEVVVVAHAAGIGVGIVGIEHGILVGAVALVGHPHLRAVGFGLLSRERQGDGQSKADEEYLALFHLAWIYWFMMVTLQGRATEVCHEGRAANHSLLFL